jgi:hypothetical protein
MARIRAHLTFANVTSLIALFVALGSTAAATVYITGANVRNGTLTSADVKNGTLTSFDIKNRSLTTVDLAPASIAGTQLKDNSISGADVMNDSLASEDIRDGALTAADFAAGQLPTGPPGPPGPTGSSAANVTVVTQELQIGAGGSAGYWALCPAGQRATGGGVGGAAPDANDHVISSGPIDSALSFTSMTTGKAPTGWYVQYYNSGADVKTILIYAVCAPAS